MADAELATVRRILAAFTPRAEVWAFGSRISGRAHPGSDLDLVVRNPADLDAAQPGLASLQAAFSDSDLPFLVDVVDWARIPESFRHEIERAHVVLRAGA